MEYTHRSPCDLTRYQRGARTSRQPVGGLNAVEAAVVVGVALLLTFATLSLFRAQSMPENIPVVPVIVSSADSLWSIARAYPIEGHSTARTVAAIRSINGKSDSALSVGEILLVPSTDSPGPSLAQH